MNDLTIWMLTFGDKVEVLEPLELREKLKNMAESMFKKYGEKWENMKHEVRMAR